jgi:hypothetical protein
MKVTTFLKQHSCCRRGVQFALAYETMEQVWDACPRADWLMFMYGRAAEPLTRTSLYTRALISAALSNTLQHRSSVAHHLNGSYLFDLCADKVERFLQDPHHAYPEGSPFEVDEDEMSEYTRCCDANATYSIAASDEAELGYRGAYYLDKMGMLLEMTICDHPLNLLSIIFKDMPDSFIQENHAAMVKAILPNPFRNTETP